MRRVARFFGNITRREGIYKDEKVIKFGSVVAKN